MGMAVTSLRVLIQVLVRQILQQEPQSLKKEIKKQSCYLVLPRNPRVPFDRFPVTRVRKPRAFKQCFLPWLGRQISLFGKTCSIWLCFRSLP